MVSNTAYRIIKKAVIIRLSQKEEINIIIESYPKLSNEQKQQLINELQQEGYIQ